MNVGLYFDLRNPQEWPTEPTRLYGFMLEMCEEAERLGCHAIWVTEHHLFDDGYRVPEFELYGADLAARYTTTDERARELRRLWGEGGITPRPVQDPLPIWMGYQGPKGARRAGLLGEGLLTIEPSLWPIYRDALVEGGHDPATGRMAGGVQGWVTEDPDGDWPVVSKHVSHQLDSYRRHMVQGTDQPVPRPVDPDKLRQRDSTAPLGYFTYGTPEEMAGWVRNHTAGAPVESVYFWASISGMPESMVAEQVRLVCTRVAPLLQEDPT